MNIYELREWVNIVDFFHIISKGSDDIGKTTAG